MLMGLIVLVLIAGVAYFHYVQGLFSATLSAIFAIIAAVCAVGFHEWIVRNFVGQYVPDLASALVLVALFAVVYTILRVVFDTYVPGHVTFPLMIDRIGGAAAGVVAGVFAAGVLVIATESLPFDPAIGGYARFPVAADPIDAKVKGLSDLSVNEVLQSDSLTPADEKHLLIPVDDIVVNLTSHLSDNGALAGPVTLAEVHPAFLDELFFQRLGIQLAAKHVALNQPGKDPEVQVKAMYSPLPSVPIPQSDAELAGLYPNRWPAPINAVLPPDPSSTLLIVRATVSGNAADKDGKVRLSPASVRLVVKGRDFMPIGTIDMTTAVQLRRDRPDDFIILDGGGTIDLAFEIPVDGEYLVPVDTKDAKNGPLKLAPGAFLEIKRFGDVELTMPAQREMPPLLPEKAGVVMRKRDLLSSPKAEKIERVTAAPAGSAATAMPAGEGPFEYASKQISADLQPAINIGPHNGNNGDVTFPEGTATLKDGKFAKLELKPTIAEAQLDQGDNKISQLYADAGQKVVQIIGTPSTKENADVWEWADKLGQFELVDNAGKSYKPRGVWVVVKAGATFEDRIAAQYDATTDLAKFDHTEGRPTDLRMFFVISDDAQPQTLKFDGKVMASVN